MLYLPAELDTIGKGHEDCSWSRGHFVTSQRKCAIFFTQEYDRMEDSKVHKGCHMENWDINTEKLG